RTVRKLLVTRQKQPVFHTAHFFLDNVLSIYTRNVPRKRKASRGCPDEALREFRPERRLLSSLGDGLSPYECVAGCVELVPVDDLLVEVHRALAVAGTFKRLSAA